MDKIEQNFLNTNLFEELNAKDLGNVEGGTRIGYWIGYGVGKMANAWTSYCNDNADVFMMM